MFHCFSLTLSHRIISTEGSITEVALALELFLATVGELRSIASGCVLVLKGPEGSHASRDEQVEDDGSQQNDHYQALRECARLLALASMTESQVLANQELYGKLASGCNSFGDVPPLVVDLRHHDEPSLYAMPASTSASTERLMTELITGLMSRMQQEAYHPRQGGASFSVVLSHDEKSQHLAGLRKVNMTSNI